MNKNELKIDENGYPTDDTLKFLENSKNFRDAKDFLETGKELVRRIFRTNRTTIGWSGCEAIACSMKKNNFWNKVNDLRYGKHNDRWPDF